MIGRVIIQTPVYKFKSCSVIGRTWKSGTKAISLAPSGNYSMSNIPRNDIQFFAVRVLAMSRPRGDKFNEYIKRKVQATPSAQRSKIKQSIGRGLTVDVRSNITGNLQFHHHKNGRSTVVNPKEQVEHNTTKYMDNHLVYAKHMARIGGPQTGKGNMAELMMPITTRPSREQSFEPHITVSPDIKQKILLSRGISQASVKKKPISTVLGREWREKTSAQSSNIEQLRKGMGIPSVERSSTPGISPSRRYHNRKSTTPGIFPSRRYQFCKSTYGGPSGQVEQYISNVSAIQPPLPTQNSCTVNTAPLTLPTSFSLVNGKQGAYARGLSGPGVKEKLQSAGLKPNIVWKHKFKAFAKQTKGPAGEDGINPNRFKGEIKGKKLVRMVSNPTGPNDQGLVIKVIDGRYYGKVFKGNSEFWTSPHGQRVASAHK